MLWTLTPIGITFDPRVPDEIAAIHAQASRTKQRRLTLATACTLLAALAVTAGIAATALTRPQPAPALHAALAPGAGGTSALLVRGRFPAHQEVTITVTPGMDTAPTSFLAVAASDGTLRDTIPVPVAPTYTVTATWTHDAARWTLTRALTAG